MLLLGLDKLVANKDPLLSAVMALHNNTFTFFSKRKPHLRTFLCTLTSLEKSSGDDLQLLFNCMMLTPWFSSVRALSNTKRKNSEKLSVEL